MAHSSFLRGDSDSDRSAKKASGRTQRRRSGVGEPKAAVDEELLKDAVAIGHVGVKVPPRMSLARQRHQ